MRCVALSINDNICVPVSGETGNWFIRMGTQVQARIWCFCINYLRVESYAKGPLINPFVRDFRALETGYIAFILFWNITIEAYDM